MLVDADVISISDRVTSVLNEWELGPDPLPRRVAAEVSPLARHVRLVGEAAGRGDVGQRLRSPSGHRVRPLEARQPPGLRGRDSELSAELFAEVAAAPAHVVGDIGDAGGGRSTGEPCPSARHLGPG